jgi:hypothetical protein
MFYRHLAALLFVSLFLPTIPAFSTTTDDGMNAGIIYGKDHSYMLSAPKGWVLDNQSGVNQGLYAVFYPKGSSWAKGSVVMYTNTGSKKKKGQETFEKMIANDVANYRDNRNTKQILDGLPIITKDGKRTALVKYFLGDKTGNYEACAYIDESKIVSFVVLTARNQKEFEANLPAFKELVQSYFFITSIVHEDAPIDYFIPPNILKIADAEYHSKVGSQYEQVMFQGNPSLVLDPGCMNGHAGWVKMVFVIGKDGSPSHIYAEKHGAVYDCLAPRVAAAKFTPPPHAPFYEYFQLNITEK